VAHVAGGQQRGEVEAIPADQLLAGVRRCLPPEFDVHRIIREADDTVIVLAVIIAEHPAPRVNPRRERIEALHQVRWRAFSSGWAGCHAPRAAS
jgi:hypothetical protein